MKKLLFFIFLLSACTQVENFEKTFYLSSSETRISYNEGSVKFEDGDVIKYYLDNTSGEARVGDNKISVAGDFNYFTGIYGNVTALEYSDDVLSFKACPNFQTGEFKDSHVSVGRALNTDEVINFNNITSLLKFTLDNDNIDYIIVKSNSNISNCDVNIIFSELDFDCNKSAADNQITVDPEDIGTYFISTLPGIIEGLEIEFFDYNGTSMGNISTDKKITLKKNSVLNLGILSPSTESINDCINIDEIPEDLSSNPSSSYITAVGKDYHFDTKYKGDSNELVGQRSKVNIIWANPENVISDLRYEKGKAYFHTNCAGNAVIGVYNKQDSLLWTWHIWASSEDIETIKLGEYTLLDRNIGDTCTTTSSEIVFQWGSPTPLYYPTVSTITSGVSYEWSSDKTIYDPCPAGWRVPDKKVWKTSEAKHVTNGIMMCDIFFPYTISFDHYGNKGLYSGGYWTVDTDNDRAYYLYFNFEYKLGIYKSPKNNCHMIRCMKK